MTDSSDFSIPGYLKLVKALGDRGYALKSFHDVEADAPHLFLRHDVDFSLDLALEMAKAEAAVGIRSTYFVLVRTVFYNVAAAPASAAIEKIAALGHEIGLHVDPTHYPDGNRALTDGAGRECAALEEITGRPVSLISFHRPATKVVNARIRFPGRLHTHEPKFSEQVGYCSDSRGAWRHGRPLDHEAVRAGRALQLLTHPVWWVVPGKDPRQKLERLLERLGETMRPEVEKQTTGIF